jgi:hypothetical protein
MTCQVFDLPVIHDVGILGTIFDVFRILTFHGKCDHVFEAYRAGIGHAATESSLTGKQFKVYEWALEVQL